MMLSLFNPEEALPPKPSDNLRTYLDHAATSWPKPPGVLESLVEFQLNSGASAGRSASTSSIGASAIVRSTRQAIAKLLHAKSDSEIALLSNGTQALNAALLGLLRRDDHVVTTAAEHNSLLRPLAMLARRIGIEWTVVGVDSHGVAKTDSIRDAIRPTTSLIAMTHASNVTGSLQPIDSVASLAKEHGIRFLLDAAQTAGYLLIDVQSQGIDILATPGHKGLCGMLGTGLLYLSESLHEKFESPWIGGTGSDSDRIEGPYHWATALESGNLNVPAIASLGAGLSWLDKQEPRELMQRGRTLRSRLIDMLDRPEFQLIGPRQTEERVSVVSVVGQSMGPQEWSALLDSTFSIETRAGLHCAGMIHPYLGTLQGGGTLRLSLGHTSHESDLDRLEQALNEILGKR